MDEEEQEVPSKRMKLADSPDYERIAKYHLEMQDAIRDMMIPIYDYPKAESILNLFD